MRFSVQFHEHQTLQQYSAKSVFDTFLETEAWRSIFSNVIKIVAKLVTELKSLALESHLAASCALFFRQNIMRHAGKLQEARRLSIFPCQEVQAAFKIILVRGYKLIYSNSAKEFELNGKSVTSPKRLCGKQKMSLACLGLLVEWSSN